MSKLSSSDNLRKVIMLSMLIAIQLILSRLGIGYRIIRIDFTFIPMSLMGMWFGTLWTGIACGVADVISATLLNGIFFPQFTVSAVLSGFLTGWFFYRHRLSWSRVVCCQLVITLFVDLLLNTCWIHEISWLPFRVILVPRLIKELVTAPLQIVIIHWLGNSQSIRALTERFFKF